MNCREMESLLGAYVDEELDLVHSLEVEAHVPECAACSASLRRLEALRSAVAREAPYYAAPPEVRAMVERRAREHFGVAERAGLSSWRPGRWLVLAAASVVAVLAVWRVAPPPLPPIAAEVVDGHVRSMLEHHLIDVASSDRHTVKPWFAGKIDFSPEVREVSGFELVGGRLDYVHGRTAAAIVYRRRQHVINVFEWPAHEGESAPNVDSRFGFQVMHWVSGGMAWWAVSDLNEAELRELGRSLTQGR